MPIAFACDCGRSLRVKDELAGRKVRCPACQQPVAVPRPQVAEAAEDDALNFLLAGEPSVERPRRRESAPPPPPAWEEAIRPVPPPRPPVPTVSKPPKPKRRRSSSRDRDSGYSGGGIAVNPEIITGILMMLGALVWFFGALALGRIYFYPPILFVLGIGAVIRGFTGRE